MTSRIQPLVTSSQLGAVLLGTRKSLKLTQQALAGRLGLSQRRLSELERAPGTLSVDQLMALCSQLGLQLSVQPQTGATTPAEPHPGEW
jgi:HTH-type transcriptional regulator / antitoxin HipB